MENKTSLIPICQKLAKEDSKTSKTLVIQTEVAQDIYIHSSEIVHVLI